MAQNLHKLGLLLDKEEYSNRASAMLASVHAQIKTYGSAYSNWGIQLLNEVFGINEIAISGTDYDQVIKDFNHHYIPNKVFLAGTDSKLPLLKDKQNSDTKIYICKNKVCQLPVQSVEDAMRLVNS